MKIKGLIKIALILSSAAIMSAFPYKVFAAQRTQMTLEYDGENHKYDSPEITLVVNGKPISAESLNIPPVIISDRTYVPVRDVFESMGATIDWKEATSEVFIGHNENLIILKVNDNNIYIDGEAKNVEAAPKIVNNRTMIPVKFASEAIGFNVDWDQETKIVSLTDENYLNNEIESIEKEEDLQENSNEVIDNIPSIPISTEPVKLATDVSTSEIPSMTYPRTKITDIVLPSTNTKNEFRIVANSEISKVGKMLLQDNRLVMDIYNAEADFSKSDYKISGSSFISTIRTGANKVDDEDVARIVFDLTAPVKFTVSISGDRKEIIIKFESTPIKNVVFTTDGKNDFITIEGEDLPSASIIMLSNPNRLAIDIPLGTIEEKTSQEKGEFVTAVRSSQFEASTARIALDLKKEIAYKLTEKEGSIIIQITEPTYKNLSYDSSASTIVIPKGAENDIDISTITHIDDYTNKKYILNLNKDYSGLLGYGAFDISDEQLKSVEIQTTNEKTTLTIKENKILAFIIEEDNENIYIKAVLPKQKYSKIVIIDPGHGGSFTGTVGNGLREKDLNISIAKKAIDLLEQDGRVKVYSTRVADVQLHTDLSTELLMRSAMANSTGDLYVSIHNNSSTGTIPNGTETYYDKSNNNLSNGISKQMADITQKNLLKELGAFDRKVQMSDFSVLRNTKIPAILVEIGFVSNAEEAAKLATSEYQMKAATAIFNSIIELFETYTPKR